MESVTVLHPKIRQVVKTIKEKDFDKAVSEIISVLNDLHLKKSKSYLVGTLNSIRDEELLPLLRTLDIGLMSHYSSFLIRYKHKNSPSPLTEILMCSEKAATGKIIEAEETLLSLILEKSDNFDKDTLKCAYSTMAYLLMDMKRLGEAREYPNKYEELEPGNNPDRWGTYYFNTGEWEKAEEVLINGISKDIYSHNCYAILQAIYTAQGRTDKALSIIEKGIQDAPYFVPLYLEKAYKLKQMGEWGQFLETAAFIDEIAPYHSARSYFIYARGQYHYENSDFTLFKNYVNSNQYIFKGSPYNSCTSSSSDNITLLESLVLVQKYNYCGPATVSMLLSRYNILKSQDEVSEHIFHINGSKSLSILEYIESMGMACSFFFGSLNKYKQLTDAGVSIIICLDYANSSHVQLLKGYDDNLQAFYIQDPNSPEFYLVTYEEFEKYYSNNQHQSIAAIPAAEKSKLEMLDSKEHYIVRDLLIISEQLENFEPGKKEEFINFLKENFHSLYVLSFGIKSFYFEDQAELLEAMIDKVMELYPDSDYFKLISANALIKIGKSEEARKLLEAAEDKRNHVYHFTEGRAALEMNDFTSAITHFKEALNYEPDHYHSWSYIGLCYFYEEKEDPALYYSNISLEINQEDDWNLFNHGMILSGLGKYSEARKVFTDLLKSFKNHYPSWIERAMCDLTLNNVNHARRGFEVANGLYKEHPAPYLELANIYTYQESDWEKAEVLLKEGLSQVANNYPLLTRLGELYEEQEQFEKAGELFTEAAAKYPEESYPAVALARILRETKGQEAAVTFIMQQSKRYQEDCPFLINGGKFLAETSNNEEHFELGSTWFETGLQLAVSNESEAWDMYTTLIENSPYIERGQKFLKQLLDDKYKENIELITYIGYLYEISGQVETAVELYRNALQIDAHPFPSYRMGEVSLKAGNLADAKKWYQTMSDLEPSITEPLLKLAEIANREGNTEAEQNYLFQVMKLCPPDINMTHLAELSVQTKKLEAVKQYLFDNEKNLDTLWRLYALAECAKAQGNLEEEEEHLLQALLIAPENPELLESLVVLKVKQGKFEEANRLVLDMISTDVEYQPVYTLFINVLIEQNKLNKVCRFLSKLKLTREEKSLACMYAGSALEQLTVELMQDENAVWKQLKLYDKYVLKLYQESYALNSDNDMSLISLYEYQNNRDQETDNSIKYTARILKKKWSFDLGLYASQLIVNRYIEQEHSSKKETEYARAEKMLARCLEEQPENPFVHYSLGRLYNETGLTDKAKLRLTRAIELDPKDHDFYYEYSRLLEKEGDLKEAEDAARKSIALQPEFLLGYNQVSTLLHQQGDTEEALNVINQLILMEENFLLAHYNKACYLSVLKQDHLTALEHLTFVLENDEEGYLTNLAVTDPDFDELRKHPLTGDRMEGLFK